MYVKYNAFQSAYALTEGVSSHCTRTPSIAFGATSLKEGGLV